MKKQTQLKLRQLIKEEIKKQLNEDNNMFLDFLPKRDWKQFKQMLTDFIITLDSKGRDKDAISYFFQNLIDDHVNYILK